MDPWPSMDAKTEGREAMTPSPGPHTLPTLAVDHRRHTQGGVVVVPPLVADPGNRWTPVNGGRWTREADSGRWTPGRGTLDAGEDKRHPPLRLFGDGGTSGERESTQHNISPKKTDPKTFPCRGEAVGNEAPGKTAEALAGIKKQSLVREIKRSENTKLMEDTSWKI